MYWYIFVCFIIRKFVIFPDIFSQTCKLNPIKRYDSPFPQRHYIFFSIDPSTNRPIVLQFFIEVIFVCDGRFHLESAMIQNPSLGCEKSDLTCWQKNLSVRPSNRKVFFWMMFLFSWVRIFDDVCMDMIYVSFLEGIYQNYPKPRNLTN